MALEWAVKVPPTKGMEAEAEEPLESIQLQNFLFSALFLARVMEAAPGILARHLDTIQVEEAGRVVAS